jgi:hypothetical protein
LDHEFSLYNGRYILDDYTNVEEHGSLEHEVWITGRTEIRAEDDTEIEVALFGF